MAAVSSLPSSSIMSSRHNHTGHGRLHKRAGSGSSSLIPSTFSSSTPVVSSPPTTLLEPTHSDYPLPPPAKSSSTVKIKPYLRKMSLKDSDDAEQGRLDLSRPLAENETVAGLGIVDFGTSSRKASSEFPVFMPTERRRSSATHARTTSLNSQYSGHSFRPTQPFVHPMRQSPRPYTPPSGPYTPTATEEEGDDDVTSDYGESADTISTHVPTVTEPWARRRSTSITSIPAPTPLSQSHTVDSGIAPSASISKFPTLSTSNLSLRSSTFSKSSAAHNTHTRSRTNTNDINTPTSPSSRTSFDKAFSLLSHRSTKADESGEDAVFQAATRAATIRAARKAYEEKEAAKEAKHEAEAAKRRELVEARKLRKEERRRRSEASSRPPSSAARRPRTADAQPRRSDGHGRRSETFDRILSGRPSRDVGPDGGAGEGNEKGVGVAGAEYESYAPAHEFSMPIQGRKAGGSEEGKVGRMDVTKTKKAKGRWVRFLAWLRTRFLRCGVD